MRGRDRDGDRRHGRADRRHGCCGVHGNARGGRGAASEGAGGGEDREGQNDFLQRGVVSVYTGPMNDDDAIEEALEELEAAIAEVRLAEMLGADQEGPLAEVAEKEAALARLRQEGGPTVH